MSAFRFKRSNSWSARTRNPARGIASLAPIPGNTGSKSAARLASSADHGSEFEGTTRSGNDVFFRTRSQLVPGASDGYEHIYDARVDGGFTQEAQAAGPCLGEACRPVGSATMFFPVPSSEDVSESGTPAREGANPTFTVGKITAAQRSTLARSGHLTLTIGATAPGAVIAVATAKLRGKQTQVAKATTALRAGKGTLTLKLSQAARSQLATRGTLSLRIEVRYQTTGAVDVAQLTLHADAQTRAASRKGVNHA